MISFGTLRSALLGLLLLLSPSLLSAGVPPEAPAWAAPEVGAVTCGIEGQPPHSSPQLCLLRLGSSEVLRLSFDLLGGQGVPLLSYRLRLCEPDWRASELYASEYLSGADSDQLPPPRPSVGTLQPYQHYELALGTELFRRSGNYLLEILDESGERSLLRVPLSVYEQRLRLEGRVTPDAWGELRGGLQQVEVELRELGLADRAALGEGLQLFVIQDGRWETAQRLGQPSGEGADGLSYRGSAAARFAAGSGYYRVEHRSDRGPFQGVGASYRSASGLLGLELHPRQSRAGQPFSYEEQRQGLQLLSTLRGELATEGDYHELSFRLQCPEPLAGQVYLEGEAFRYMPLVRRELRYDAATRSYQLALRLKQGYQEYQFVYRPEGSDRLETATLMGDHYQTEHHYTVLAYARSHTDRTPRLWAVLQL